METNRPGRYSYLSIPGQYPLSSQTIGELVDNAAARFQSSEAAYFGATQERLSFADIKYESERLAAGLLKIGLQPGDRVGIWGPNSRRWYITFLALAKSGIISVFLNPAYRIPEILYCINHVGMKGIVVAEPFKTQNYCEMLAKILPQLKGESPATISSDQAVTMTTIIAMEKSPSLSSAHSYDDIMKLGSAADALEDLEQVSATINFDDVSNIQFTSGTTGKPKAVMLTHHNLVNNSELIGKAADVNSSHRSCTPLPLFHIYGSIVGVLGPLHNGSSAVFPAPGYDPAQTITLCATERCTTLGGTPTMHIDMMKVFETKKDLDLNSLYKVSVSGAPCSKELRRLIKRNYNVTLVVTGYGMTEASGIISIVRPSDPDDVRRTTVGAPLEHMEVKIVDKEGNILPVGTPGELCLRGYQTMRGYWKDPDRTREVLDDTHWLHTGDLISMEPSGHLKFAGRIKDMIIRGGENIYPCEIEEFLNKLPGIMEVHVFGIPDARLGEAVATWIRLKEGHSMTEEDVRAACAGQIAHFKIPKFIKFTTEFPKTVSGKIQKFRLQELTLLEIEAKVGLANSK